MESKVFLTHALRQCAVRCTHANTRKAAALRTTTLTGTRPCCPGQYGSMSKMILKVLGRKVKNRSSITHDVALHRKLMEPVQLVTNMSCEAICSNAGLPLAEPRTSSCVTFPQKNICSPCGTAAATVEAKLSYLHNVN